MTEELKPCPFCGKNPKNEVFAGTYCSNEGCAIFEVEFSGGAQSWNTRATPAPAQPEPKGTTLDEKSPVKSPAEGSQEDEPVALVDTRNNDLRAHWTDRTEAAKLEHGTPLYLHPSRSAGAAALVEGAAQGWISVKDQLPEPWIEVLVHPRPTDACCEGHVDRAGLWQYTEYDSWGCNPRACVVTHWFSPPAAPKDPK